MAGRSTSTIGTKVPTRNSRHGTRGPECLPVDSVIGASRGRRTVTHPDRHDRSAVKTPPRFSGAPPTLAIGPDARGAALRCVGEYRIIAMLNDTACRCELCEGRAAGKSEAPASRRSAGQDRRPSGTAPPHSALSARTVRVDLSKDRTTYGCPPITLLYIPSFCVGYHFLEKPILLSN